MFKKIKLLIFAWRLRRAIRQANDLANLTGLRQYVILLNGSLHVVSKKAMQSLINRHRFRRGTRIIDIEKRALHVTKIINSKAMGGA
jgi:hypothetical protein